MSEAVVEAKKTRFQARDLPLNLLELPRKHRMHWTDMGLSQSPKEIIEQLRRAEEMKPSDLAELKRELRVSRYVFLRLMEREGLFDNSDEQPRVQGANSAEAGLLFKLVHQHWLNTNDGRNSVINHLRFSKRELMGYSKPNGQTLSASDAFQEFEKSPLTKKSRDWVKSQIKAYEDFERAVKKKESVDRNLDKAPVEDAEQRGRQNRIRYDDPEEDALALPHRVIVTVGGSGNYEHDADKNPASGDLS